MDNQIITKAKNYFYDTIKSADEDRWNLLVHIPEAEKWADKILVRYPGADKEIIILSVWLHDISHYEGDWAIDHAMKGEKRARKFLIESGYTQQKVDQVCHCIRAHRNKDVPPETLEAKLVCLIDSVSHFTYAPYIEMVRDDRGKEALEKLERDFNDLKVFPEIEHELTPVYEAWKKLLIEILKVY